MAYVEPCHIQNLSIFSTPSMRIWAYSDPCVMLAYRERTLQYSELCYIQNCGIIRS